MLVVSEFIGCSPSLSGAIRVNPWDIDSFADAMDNAKVPIKRMRELEDIVDVARNFKSEHACFFFLLSWYLVGLRSSRTRYFLLEKVVRFLFVGLGCNTWSIPIYS
ncbi:alpha,alpha-trehalose-phosphate synthase [UDP-forming] 6 [Tanacetum coccineum]